VLKKKQNGSKIINTDPFMTRRTGVENSTGVATRDITDLEIEEYINFLFQIIIQNFLGFIIEILKANC
jgi:hypothetical protein